MIADDEYFTATYNNKGAWIVFNVPFTSALMFSKLSAKNISNKVLE